MKNGISHLVRTAISDFRRNKVRTLLTSLGIMIGVFAVVLLLALGLGLKNYLKEQFEDLGTNLLMVFPGSGFGDGGSFGQGFTSLAGSKKFDEKDLRNLKRLSTAKYVVPGHIASMKVESRDKTKTASVQGVNEDFDDMFNLELLSGEFFDSTHVATSAKVGVIAEALARDLFGDVESAVGNTVQAKSMRVKLIGVVKNIGDPEQDNSIMVPYTTTYLTLNPNREFLAFYIGVKDNELIDEAILEIEEMLLDRYEEDEFNVIEPSKFLDAFSQILNAVNGILIAIGSISLLVGGIGIMNIMYATVTERTKEVGIRRAVGATETDILFQFLVESTILSLMGGLSGLLIAAIIVFFVRFFFPMEISLLAIVLSLGIPSLIGIIFGILPAKRAAKLTPLEAIRFK